jgi:hypothetical protein
MFYVTYLRPEEVSDDVRNDPCASRRSSVQHQRPSPGEAALRRRGTARAFGFPFVGRCHDRAAQLVAHDDELLLFGDVVIIAGK